MRDNALKRRWFYPGVVAGIVGVMCVFSLTWVWWEKQQCDRGMLRYRRVVIQALLRDGTAILQELRGNWPVDHPWFRFGASGSVAVLDPDGGVWGEMPGGVNAPHRPVSKKYADRVRSWFSQLHDRQGPVELLDLPDPGREGHRIHIVAVLLDRRGTIGVAGVSDWEVARMLQPYREAIRSHMGRFTTVLLWWTLLASLATAFTIFQMARRVRREVETFSQSLGVSLSTGKPMASADQPLIVLAPLVPYVNDLIVQWNQALTDLTRSERRYRRLFHGNAMGIWVLDARELFARLGELRSNGVTNLEAYMKTHPGFVETACRSIQVVDANREAVRMYGADSRSQLITSLDRVVGGMDSDHLRAILVGLFNGESRIQVLGKGARLDGGRMDVWYTLFRLARREAGLLAMNTLDVTARMSAMRELEAETEQLQTLLASMADGVIVTDRNGRICRMNQAACELTGFSETEMMGNPLAQVYRTTSRQQNLLGESGIRPFLRQDHDAVPSPAWLHDKQGKKRLVEERRSALLQRDGRFAGMVLVFRDVTEQWHAREELNRIQKLQSLGVFAGGIAHQFNNLMTALFGRVALARMFAEPGSPVDRKLAEVERMMDRARGLTAKLLTFSRGGEPVRSRKPVWDMVQQALSLVQDRASLEAQLDIPSDVPDVNVDEAQVVQMLDCLLQNAVDACEENCRVRISARQVDGNGISGLDDGTYVCLDVTDNGPGIPEDILDQVFDPYFTTREEGQGLGLSIVYGIVKRHGGHVMAENVGSGVRISVFLPAVES